LPELQGRLPIRVLLSPLTEDDMLRILTEPEASLTKQYVALMATEGAAVNFAPEGVKQLAKLATKFNREVENIGARRLHTIMEKLMEEASFESPDKDEMTIEVDATYVDAHIGEMAKATDLDRFIL
jgi:ATP-dependent HslUV protease ATP-binding subunit HslU